MREYEPSGEAAEPSRPAVERTGPGSSELTNWAASAGNSATSATLGRVPSTSSHPFRPQLPQLPGRPAAPARTDPGESAVEALAEQAARTAVARHVGALERTSGVAAPAAVPVLARYQAGSSGHGGIEEPALRAAGFSAEEAHSTYAGNWLRDLSQLPKHPAVTTLIRILSLGEFGRDTSAEELGGYAPSEHMDNPEGGGTAHDPAVRRDPARLQAALDKLSPAQRAAYDREEAARADILAASKASHLPEYIERGKFHAKEKLREAVSAGRNPQGMRAMGDALHAIEDYFSHSNFTEACIFMLRADPAMKPLVSRMAETHLGANQALLTPVDPKTGEVQIQAGTYTNGPNDWVSRLELLQSEVENGELRKSFAIGWLRMAGITGEELGRRLGERAGGGVGGAIGGAGGAIVGGIGGAVSGAASGAVAGFRRGRGFLGTIGSTLGGLASGAGGGAVSGAASGARTGAEMVGGAGSSVGGAIGAFAGKSVAEVVAMVGLGAILAIISIPFAAITAAAKTGLLEKLAEQQTDASGTQARRTGLSGPTHSELSKDAPHHKLFDASAALAAAADKEIGTEMIKAWGATPAAGAAAPSGGTGSAPAPPSGGGGTATAVPPRAAPAFTPEQEAVAALVDKYVCHPTQQTWWQPVIKAEAAKAGAAP